MKVIFDETHPENAGAVAAEVQQIDFDNHLLTYRLLDAEDAEIGTGNYIAQLPETFEPTAANVQAAVFGEVEIE